MSRRLIVGLAVMAGLAVPSTASAATGTITIQSNTSAEVTGEVTVTSNEGGPYGPSWFMFVAQVDAQYACNLDDSSNLVMSSIATHDGSLPRDEYGSFSATGTYTTTFQFTPTHEPRTKICLYVSTASTPPSQIIAEIVINTTVKHRIGAICSDGWRSTATGSGACSSHGGVSYWLYSSDVPTTPKPKPTPIPQPPITVPLPTPAPIPVPVAEPAEPVNHSVICRSSQVSEPRSCSIRAGRVKLSKLAWRTWNDAAKGVGKVSFDGGKLRKATITLSQPKEGVYTKMTIKMAHSKTRRLVLRAS
jgi:hypothetical protein